MLGIEGGINTDATQVLLNSTKCTHADKRLLRSVLLGGMRTQDRKFRAGITDTKICQFCKAGLTEDHEHI
eukprot:3049002-Karenia_brevis.AAC.1